MLSYEFDIGPCKCAAKLSSSCLTQNHCRRASVSWPLTTRNGNAPCSITEVGIVCKHVLGHGENAGLAIKLDLIS